MSSDVMNINSECNIIKPKRKKFRVIDSNEEEDDRKVKKLRVDQNQGMGNDKVGSED